MKNFFCLVLHSHIPYVKKSGVWPFGEEWLFEGMLETYVPILEMLREITSAGVESRVTIGITPVLAEQLSDEYIKTRFVDYVRDKIRRAQSDAARFARMRNSDLENLARSYADVFRRRLDYYEKINADITGEFAELHRAGVVEIITSAATHAYLPLLSRDSSVFAQVRMGVRSCERIFGAKPRGFWLPECAYRDAYEETGHDGKRIRRKALDEYLAAEGIKYFFVDTHAVEGGATSRYSAAGPEVFNPLNGSSALAAYKTRAGVSVLARNREAGMLVWSSELGYPGDGAYREFHKKDSVSGLQYWRITSKKTDLGAKEIYSPASAAGRVASHAAHFGKVVSGIFDRASSVDSPCAIVAPYDSELYGHWWHEGVDWLRGILCGLPTSGASVATASRYLSEVKRFRKIKIPETSWGDGGGHYVWLNKDTQWMWRMIHECERKMEESVSSAGRLAAAPERRKILEQMAREKVLLESSDWEFLVTTAQARDYGEKRFLSHYNRFMTLAGMLAKTALSVADENSLAAMADADSPFPDIKPEDCAARG